MARLRYIIIGAGQAGFQAAAAIRTVDKLGYIALIGAERTPPYQRPPLSTTFLMEDGDPSELLLGNPDFYEGEGIDLVLGETVAKIDRQSRVVFTNSGRQFGYDRLLLATGATARHPDIKGADARGVHYLRTVEDAVALQASLSTKRDVVIMGGGYIGMEVAAAIVTICSSVTVIEQAEHVLQRVASRDISEYLASMHSGQGVRLCMQRSIVEVVCEGGQVAGVKLDNGETLTCSTVIIAIGSKPAIELASAADLQVDNGVAVDVEARTSDENIWAAGDCASFPSGRYQRRLRLESEPHAIDHATLAALNMAGDHRQYDPLPWFWSEQYDLRLQIAGLPSLADRSVIRGSVETGRFSVWHFLDGQLIALECVNDAKTFNSGRKLIDRDIAVDPAILIDTSRDIRELLN